MTPALMKTPTPTTTAMLSTTSPMLDSQPTLQPATFLNFDREVLFSPKVARSVGLDPETHAILEVPNGSGLLYNAILLYAANFAVDLHENAPSSSSQHDPSSPPPILDSSDTRSKSSPDQASSSSSNCNAASIVVPSDELDIESQFSDIRRGMNGTMVPKREGPGRLSTLWSCPDDRHDPLAYSGYDSEDSEDSDSGPDILSEANISEIIGDHSSKNRASMNAEASNVSSSELLHSSISGVGMVQKRMEPPIQRYQMGIGYAKVSLGENVVYIHHCAFGLPVSESYSIQVFRTIALAAEESWKLKEFCAVALKWRSDREQPNTYARAGRYTLFRWKTNGEGREDWCKQGNKRTRPPKSLILPNGQLESIVRDIKEFMAHDTKDWYEAHGLPHRRSYLFYGPQGSGKSSTVKMIAGLFHLNACFLRLTSSDLSDQMLHNALLTTPRRALLVLEDVDVLFNEDRRNESFESLTISGMLNALEGLVSVDGIITIFTANHIEKIDPALLRGGRVDRRFEFTLPCLKQIVALFKTFYEDAPDELAYRFANTVLSRPEKEAKSIATLQQHFIFTRKLSAEQCVEMIPKFFSEFFPRGCQPRNSIYI